MSAENKMTPVDAAMGYAEKGSEEAPLSALALCDLRENFNEECSDVAMRILAAEVRRLRELVPQWRPIETAPKDGTRINLLHSNNTIINTGYWDKEFCYDNLSGSVYNWRGGWTNGFAESDGEPVEFAPTHWQPLPKAPESGAKS